MIEVLEASFLHTAFDLLFKGHQDLHSRVRVEFTKSGHVIYAPVAEKTEVDGALRNSLTIGRGLGMSQELAPECVYLQSTSL